MTSFPPPSDRDVGTRAGLSLRARAIHRAGLGWRVGRAVAVMCAAAAAVTIQAQTPEDLARRQLDSGRKFLVDGNYKEALADFERVLQIYPTSAVADDALLEIAAYHLDVERDLAAATRRTSELLKTYPNSDSAARAYVLDGRIALARGRSSERITEAISNFDRVPRLFPGSETVPEAMYFAAEAAWIDNRPDTLDRFTQLAIEYPRSPWTPQALLGTARSLVAIGQPLRAMERLQRLRSDFPSAREPAARALEWNTILYRLHVRAPAQQPYVFSRGVSGTGGRLRDVVDIEVNRDNGLFVATNSGVLGFDAAGAMVAAPPRPRPRGLFVDARNRVLTIHEPGGVRADDGAALDLAMPGGDGRPRPLKIQAVVTTSAGEYIVAAEDQRGVLRFTSSGQPIGAAGGQIRPRRLAISDLDDVAALDVDGKSVTLFDRDGRIAGQIGERGAGYQLRRPADVAFDRLGYLYVLDREAVFVFAPRTTTLVATFTPPERTPGGFDNPQFLALDAAARLHVFDAGSSQVQVYR